jgi:hypothetical protein
MSKLRRAAQGQPCQLRIPLVCDGGSESGTTVLAHIRRGGVAGVGMKPNDLIAIRCCAPCHARLDRREGLEAVPDEYILEALCRTLDAVVREGLVKC